MKQQDDAMVVTVLVSIFLFLEFLLFVSHFPNPLTSAQGFCNTSLGYPNATITEHLDGVRYLGFCYRIENSTVSGDMIYCDYEYTTRYDLVGHGDTYAIGYGCWRLGG